MSEENSVRVSVSPEDFVKVWQKANSRKEVATALGMKYNAVVSREKTYRKAGIPLKEINNKANRGRRIDVASLSALCQPE
jgi:hypothetical protein